MRADRQCNRGGKEDVENAKMQKCKNAKMQKCSRVSQRGCIEKIMNYYNNNQN